MADPLDKKPYEDIRILILEDNPVDAELVENELREAGFVFNSQLVENKQSYVKALREFYPDIILSDYDLPGFSGVEALRIRKDMCPETPFILVTGAVGEERAIEILTGGATDYVLKKNLSSLLPAVSRALHEAYEHRKRKEAEADRDSLMNDLERRVRERTEAFQAEITERKRAEEARSRQVAFENIISGILSRFASCTAAEVDEEITAGLKEIGLFLGLERVFVILVLEGNAHVEYSLQLDGPGSPLPVVQKYQNVPYWNQSLERESSYCGWNPFRSTRWTTFLRKRIRATGMGKRRFEIDAPGSTSRPRSTCNRLCRISFLFPSKSSGPRRTSGVCVCSATQSLMSLSANGLKLQCWKAKRNTGSYSKAVSTGFFLQIRMARS